ncbi:MAG: sensor histidine kinase [Lachnospiraceae bacterium]|nr:sensor histidine kinase [Lachnospiraceae bacterium]
MKAPLRLNNLFRNMKLKYKLAMIYIIAGAIPMCILLVFTFYQMRDILREREEEALSSYLYQASSSMDNEIAIYNNLASYISFDQELAQALGYQYTSSYDMYEQLTTVLDPTITSLLYFHDKVERITIYLDKALVKHGTTLAPLSEITGEPWYAEVMLSNNLHWYADPENTSLFAIGKMVMLNRYNAIGVLYTRVDYESVFKPFDQTILHNFGIFVTDESDNLVYEHASFDPENEDFCLTFETFKELNTSAAATGHSSDGKYRLFSCDSSSTGWRIWLYKPETLLISSITPIQLVAAVALCVSTLGAALCIFMISWFITRRITRLRNHMEEVEQGNFLSTVQPGGHDEIGDLMEGFDHMRQRLNTLITEVSDSRIKEKEYEMRALQAQINPHFLYNSLSLINWKALEAGAQDISQITLSLSTFYRTALNRGSNILTVADEINNMKSYLDIQLVMHDYEFDTNIQIEESILRYKTLNLILQPLIENAIVHGIDMLTDRRGVITITGRENGEEIELIVEDNGVGMEEAQAQKILTEDSKGYGVRNVNERIRLYYGEPYALTIKSTPGIGTRAFIHFPKQF